MGSCLYADIGQKNRQTITLGKHRKHRGVYSMGFSINNPFNSLLLPAIQPPKSPQTAKIDQLIKGQNDYRSEQDVSLLIAPNGQVMPRVLIG
jgi:hypothetical protein